MRKTNLRILAIDDNEDILIALQLLLRDFCANFHKLKDPGQMYSLFHKNEYDVVILDMNFIAGKNTGNEGFYWMNEILKLDADVSIVFLTAFGEVQKAVQAIHEGAVDYIEKPWDDNKLVTSLIRAGKLTSSKRELKNLRNENKKLKQAIRDNQQFYHSKSPNMLELMKTIDKVAQTDANVLILGENGTGKEVIARQLHEKSLRAENSFVHIDLGTIPHQLIESELFGHEKGAFTDAKENKPGKFVPAHNGTLFLDEIGNLSVEMQSKLLTFIQNKSVHPLGATTPVHVDARLICATNMDVYDAITTNQFREDLLYRINTVTIEIPPLRERKADIEGLAHFFLQQFCNKYKKPIQAIEQKAIDYLKTHQWPGNIREFQHTIEKAIILTESDTLQKSDFGFRTSGHHSVSSLNIEENEFQLIKKALSKHRGNHTEAANELGITRRTLYNKIKKYGL